MDWIVSSPKFICETLTPNVTIFGDRTFEEVTQFKWSAKDGALLQQDWYPYK